MDEIKKEEPQPIEFRATFHPDGRLEIHFPLINNPLLAMGFMEMLRDEVKRLIKEGPPKPKIEKALGSFLNGLRRMGR